jgi:hypothetical protein
MTEKKLQVKKKIAKQATKEKAAQMKKLWCKK